MVTNMELPHQSVSGPCTNVSVKQHQVDLLSCFFYINSKATVTVNYLLMYSCTVEQTSYKFQETGIIVNSQAAAPRGCSSSFGWSYTQCPEKNGPPKQNAVTCTIYNTIQWHLHSIIEHSFRHCVLNFNELRFLCCDSFYLLELTLKTQVSNTMNTVGISSNDKYLFLLQLMLKVPSISTQVGSRRVRHWSLPHRWCCDPSRTTPLSVAPSGWRHKFLSGRHVPAAGPRSHSRLDWTVTFLLMHNFYQHAIFPADYTILFLFMQKLCKRWRQYWQGINKQ